MATIIPDSALGDRAYGVNAGEKYLLNKFKNCLPDSCLVWHNPDLPNHYQPDIVLYVPRLGIIIIEVKDWNSGTICCVNKDAWELDVDGRTKRVTSPLEQVRGYYHGLNQLFESKGVLIADAGPYKGHFKLPITYLVAFTKLRRKDLPPSAQEFLDPGRFLFRDELEEIGNSVKGAKLAVYLEGLFKPWWPPAVLNESELNSLRGALYPEITLSQNTKAGQKRIILDITQEQMAKKVDSGHTIVRGIAGSGKSLVLCAKAKIIAETHPDWKTLIVCFNNSLKSQLDFYLKHLNDIFITKPAKPNWEVAAFYSLLFKLAKSLNYKDLPRNLFQNEAGGRSEEELCAIAGGHLQKMAALPGAPRYDALLIDESQDFHYSWLKGLMCLLKPETNFVILAEDPNQKIYKRNFTYKEAGLNVAGRVRKLPVAYRSTKEIILPATQLVQNSDPDEFFKQYVGDDNFATLFKESGGAAPELVVVPGDKTGEFLLDNITNDVKCGLSYSDIAIICPQKYQTERCCEYLGRHNIPVYWLVKDRESKNNYTGAEDKVLLTTVHSSKGLEFEKVYFVNIETFPVDYLNERENASMVYVAMTRAKKRLTIVSGSTTPTFSKIKETVQKYCATTE